MTSECENEQSDYRIDLSRLPIKLVDRSAASAGANMLVVGVLLIGLPTLGLVAAAGSGTYRPVYLLALLGTAAGIGLFLAGLRLFSRRVTTVITAESVTMETKSAYGRREWTEPLSGYDGVLSETEQQSSGGRRGETHTAWTVSLHHRDPDKCILLYEARSDAGVAAYLEKAAATFKLPAVETPPDHLTTEPQSRREDGDGG